MVDGAANWAETELDDLDQSHQRCRATDSVRFRCQNHSRIAFVFLRADVDVVGEQVKE